MDRAERKKNAEEHRDCGCDGLVDAYDDAEAEVDRWMAQVEHVVTQANAEVERLRGLYDSTHAEKRQLTSIVVKQRDAIERVRALVPEDNFDFDDAPEDVWRFVRDLRAAVDREV